MRETDADGVIKVKIPASREIAEECGVVRGEWLLLMLQTPNKGSSRQMT